MDKCERRTLQTFRGAMIEMLLVRLCDFRFLGIESSLRVHPLSPRCQEDGDWVWVEYNPIKILFFQ